MSRYSWLKVAAGHTHTTGHTKFDLVVRQTISIVAKIKTDDTPWTSDDGLVKVVDVDAGPASFELDATPLSRACIDLDHNLCRAGPDGCGCGCHGVIE